MLTMCVDLVDPLCCGKCVLFVSHKSVQQLEDNVNM